MLEESLRRRAILSSYLGWVLDGYDALLITPIMPLLGDLFFPGPYSFLGGLSTLVATLIGRPLGSVAMGYVGDKLGRRIGLLITVLGYSLAALAMAVMPTYNEVGIIAPLSLLTLRFIQGIFLGGEWGPGTAMIMEWSKWRSEWASAFVQSGYPIGVVMATLVYTGFTSFINQPAFSKVWWRVYIATGIVAAVIAFLIRSRLMESPLWRKPRGNPLTLLFKLRGRSLGMGIMFTGGLLTIYYSTYLIYSELLAYIGKPWLIPSVMLAATVAAVAAVLLAGPLSFVINYKWVVVITLALSLAFAPYALMINPSFTSLVALAFIENFAMGLVPHALVSKFEPEYRASGLGIAYNWGLLIGGWAPMLVGLIRPMNLGMLVMMVVGVLLAVAGILLLATEHPKH
ncbi:MFS transporter [Vulcanisaeta thermophila]|uniref:MFS transporter n=1 Tax=Vulcanisaeta thermophila TaxID=867917 RepID=UPI000853A235|nr:MFS transporter [Vulcanisaeta thermophila]